MAERGDGDREEGVGKRRETWEYIVITRAKKEFSIQDTTSIHKKSVTTIQQQ